MYSIPSGWRAFPLGQCDHCVREIDAHESRDAHAAQQPRIESLAAGNVNDILAGQVADEFQEREGFDLGAPGLQLRAFVLFGDGIVVGRHVEVFG